MPRNRITMEQEHPLHFKWNWQLRSEPEYLWPLIADTNRLFKNIGLPTVEPTDISYEIKDAHLQLSYNSIKYADAWIEEPYNWEYPFRYDVRRTYKSGSFSRVKIQVDLHPNDQGTRLQYQVWASPNNRFLFYLFYLKYKITLRSRLKATFKKYAELVEKEQLPYEYSTTSRISRKEDQRLQDTKVKLYECCSSTTIVDKLCDFIRRADDIDLIRIEPFKLAEKWQEKPDNVLNVFLKAVKNRLLNFNWDIYCPNCRTIQQRCKTLSEIHEPVFCHDCHLEFTINFSQSLQLSFRPNPLIRKINDSSYSLAGPQEKPHVLIQQYLEPGQERYVKTHLKDGVYRLHSTGSDGSTVIKVHEGGQDTINVRLTGFGFGGMVEITNEPNLIFQNQTVTDQLFVLEKMDWDAQKVTAAQVTSLQTFRDLFGHEVLKKGEKIAVDDLTFMFTDIFGSTSMYNQEGDNQAVGRVIEHFEILQNAVARENGALVKTIGDSVMAVFSNPDKAFKAFITAQEIISKDDRYNKSLKLKAGIHHGSCVAVNLNNKIDYFGTTVNIASRLVDTAHENEVVISQNVARNNTISDLLEGKYNHFDIRQEQVPLRGFNEEKFDLKRIRLEQSALRLVI